jgi:hypothetical protein
VKGFLKKGGGSRPKGRHAAPIKNKAQLKKAGLH